MDLRQQSPGHGQAGVSAMGQGGEKGAGTGSTEPAAGLDPAAAMTTTRAAAEAAGSTAPRPPPAGGRRGGGLLRSPAVFSAMTLLSRIAGFLRDALQSRVFGV